MAFESLNQALGTVITDIAHQRSPSGIAELIGKRLENKLIEETLTQLFPIQVEQLRKTVDFMTSEPEKQRLEIEKQQRIDEFKSRLAESLEGVRHRYGMSKQGLLGEQKLEQIDREWGYRLQEKKIPSTILYGNKELTPQEILEKAALSGKFSPELLEEAQTTFEKTGNLDLSLFKQVDKTPKFGSLTTEETENLEDRIKNTKAFKKMLEDKRSDYSTKNPFSSEFYKTPSQKLFDDIVAGNVQIKDPNLKAMFDSYRYSTTGVSTTNDVVRIEELQAAGVPGFANKEQFEKWVIDNQNKIAESARLKSLLQRLRVQNGW